MKRIGYLILAHADPKQLARLIDAIDYHAKFFVHLDAKSDIREFQKLPLPGNVTFIQSRVNVAWGGISMIDATLALLEAAVKSGEDFDHVVLLSGADYPLQKKSLIYNTITSKPGHEFIKYIDMRQSSHYIKQVAQKWFKEPIFWTGQNKTLKYADKAIRIVGNKMKFNNNWDKSVVPYFGSQWWALTPACALYILKYVKDNPGYYEKNKYSFSPDEHFFHTIVGNSIYKDKADGLQQYQGRGTWRLANLHVIHESLTKWYTIDDWNDIKSSEKLFVRKVNSAVSESLLDVIDKKILQ